jgi:hypothetical protein
MNKSFYVLKGQRGCHFTNGSLDYVDIRVNPNNPQALRHLFWLLDHGCIDYNGAAACLAYEKLVDAAAPDTYNVVRFRIRDWWHVPDNSVGWFRRMVGKSMLRRYARWCAQHPNKGGRC